MYPYYANRLRKKVEWKGAFPSKKVRERRGDTERKIDKGKRQRD